MLIFYVLIFGEWCMRGVKTNGNFRNWMFFFWQMKWINSSPKNWHKCRIYYLFFFQRSKVQTFTWTEVWKFLEHGNVQNQNLLCLSMDYYFVAMFQKIWSVIVKYWHLRFNTFWNYGCCHQEAMTNYFLENLSNLFSCNVLSSISQN